MCSHCACKRPTLNNIETTYNLSTFIQAILFWCKPASVESFVSVIIFNAKVIAILIKEYIDIKLVGYLKQEFNYSSQTAHAQTCEQKLNEAIEKTISEYRSIHPLEKLPYKTIQAIFDQFQVIIAKCIFRYQ